MKNDCVLIIGGSSGIGYEIVKNLLSQKKQVINCSRRKCCLDGVINYLIDVTKKEEFLQVLEEIFVLYKVKTIIYSAGVSMASPFTSVRTKDYLHLFQVNFFSVVEVLKCFCNHLSSYNQFIIISSLGATLPIIYDPYYSASKIALEQFIWGVQLEYKHTLRCSIIVVGGVKTGFTFKRKVYQFESDYLKKEKIVDFDSGVEVLAKMEQFGLSPKMVGKKVAKLVGKKRVPFILVVGFKNKIYYILAHLLPKKILSVLIRFKFKQK